MRILVFAPALVERLRFDDESDVAYRRFVEHRVNSLPIVDAARRESMHGRPCRT
jgi:hypothetical protein